MAFFISATHLSFDQASHLVVGCFFGFLSRNDLSGVSSGPGELKFVIGFLEGSFGLFESGHWVFPSF
jgi:hypothetical protein